MKIPQPDSWVHKQPGGATDPAHGRGPGGDQPRHDGDQPGRDRIGTDSERKRADALQAIIERKRGKEEQRPRKDRCLPMLLVRSAAGDRGDRPVPGVFWESPDIWVAAGDPSATPDLPASPGGSVTAGVANTVYAHVWNLGKVPIAGVVVEYYWFDPSLTIDAAHAHRIGVARVDLGPRNSPTCHKLVKCPTAWTPVMANGGHECLVVRVRVVGDDIAPTSWSPVTDRHIGQRNMSVVAGASVSGLILSLEKTRPRTGMVQLVQVGPHESPSLALLGRKLKADPQIKTHVLAELTPDGRIVTPPTTPHAPATFPAVGRVDMLKLSTVTRAAFDVRRIATTDVLRNLAPTRGLVAPITAPAAATGVHALLDHHRTLPRDLSKLLVRAAHPPAGHAQVLRVATFDDKGQLVGGYTMVIRG